MSPVHVTVKVVVSQLQTNIYENHNVSSKLNTSKMVLCLIFMASFRNFHSNIFTFDDFHLHLNEPSLKVDHASSLKFVTFLTTPVFLNRQENNFEDHPQTHAVT